MYINISIALNLQKTDSQIQMYDVPSASSIPYQSGEWIGNTEKGGSCNFSTLTITPHCNGTHLECIGHIVHDKISVPDIVSNPFFQAILISIPYRTLDKNLIDSFQEHYQPKLELGDKVLTYDDIAKVLNPYLSIIRNSEVTGLIIRTLPNDSSKIKRNYNIDVAPFFTNDAIQYINSLGFEHLLVDIPSLDRAYDEGLLSNHHIFWNQSIKNYHLEDKANKNKTITELIYVPNEVLDGVYETFLAFPQWMEEAVPSSVWIKHNPKFPF